MLRFIFSTLLGLLLLGIISVALVSWYVVPQLPESDNLRDVELQVPLRVYSRDGSLIAEFGEMRRSPLSIDDIPPQVVKAFLAAEDDRFYQHPGVDWQGILRAGIHVMRTGDKTQGGSTITMQVARNFFLTREKTYLRKLNEVILALKIERELSKNEILELYLNKIYLGQRAYGVAAAAQVYYGTDVDQLNLAQAAMIAGLPKAPSTTNPVTNPERARERRTYVLNRMLRLGYISHEQHQTAINAPVAVRLHSANVELEAPYVAEMVRQYMVDEYGEEATYTSGFRVYTTVDDHLQGAANRSLREALLAYDKRHGYRGPEHHHEDFKPGMNETDLSRLLLNYSTIGGLKPAVITAIGERTASAYLKGVGAIEIPWEGLSWARPYKTENWTGSPPESAGDVVAVGDIVRLAEEQKEAAEEADEENANGTEAEEAGAAEIYWRLSQLPAVEGALVSLDPHDGATLALAGGFDFERSKFNRATQAQRQPGSSFKPFIYSAGLAAGYTPASIINDAPVVFPDPSLKDDWRPENYSGRSYGPTRLREALIHSRNLVSIRLLNAMGIPHLMNHLWRFGFDTDKLPANLSLSLGSGAVTPYQLARAFTVFANGGFLIEPYFIERIERSDDEGVVFEAEPLIACDTECQSNKNLVMADGRNADSSDTEAVNQTAAEEMILDSGLIPLELEADEKRIAPRTLPVQNAWLITSMTQDVVRRGTGARAYRELQRNDLSGKTGTTNDQRDAWFAGFNHDITTVAWVGFDDYQPLGNRETGAQAALPMWIDFMRVALEGRPESTLPRPQGLVNARIDPDTGKLASAGNPDAIFEVFPAERVPTDFSREQQEDGYSDSDYSEQLF